MATGKALGAEIAFEFVATNDLQPRITASLQSGWGRRHHHDAVRLSLMTGGPGPASAKATEAQSKFIVPDMYAQAARGMKAEDAVKWAETELNEDLRGVIR